VGVQNLEDEPVSCLSGGQQGYVGDDDGQPETYEDPPVLVPSVLPDALIRSWVGFSRALGDALRVDGKDRALRERVARAIDVLVAHDDFTIGRVIDGQGIIWLRPTDDDHHDDPDLSAMSVPIDDPVVARVLADGVHAHQPTRLVVPLRLGRQLTGVVDIRHDPPWEYTADHLAAASLIGEQLGPMIELMFQYKQEELTRKRLATLIEINRAISHSLDLDQILPVMGRSLMEALSLPSCLIALRNDDDTHLVPRVVLGDDVFPPGWDQSKPLPHPPVAFDDPTAAKVLALRSPSVITLPPAFRNERRALGFPVPDRALLVPLVVRDHFLGLALLPIRDDTREFGEAALALAMGVAQSAGVAIEHAQLYARAREVGMVDERNRLAREVHDTLAQGLTAIALQLETAERLMPPGAEAKRIVADAREQAHRSLDEARRAVWGLTARLLDGASLPEALQGEVERFSRRTGVPAQMVREADGAAPTDEQATALLRVAQEALHNIEKHAEPTRVRVELHNDPSDGLLTLLIADDGKGFDRKALPGPNGGFGLSGMQERMRLFGGDLEVESAPGWGTRVRARLHLDPVVDVPAAVPEPADPIRVLLVDDHPLAREGLRRLLAGRDDVMVMGEAGDGLEGVERALALRPDVILMDLQMPRLSGVGAVQALHAQWPEVNVLIVTTFAQDEHLFEALRAGARGYLLKDAGADELAAAIKTVHAGGSLVQPAMASRLLDRFGELAMRERLPETLTEREIEVLKLAAAGARNKEIAERLVISEKTAKNTLSRVYGKLGAGSRAEAVARGRSLGLLPLDDAQFEQDPRAVAT
jgi:DNA-binding NarL/FixJ family response regulator/signal transduction histidine kinase